MLWISRRSSASGGASDSHPSHAHGATASAIIGPIAKEDVSRCDLNMDLKIGSTNTNKIHACTTVISRHISHHQHHQDRGGHGDKCCNRIWVVYVPRVLYRHSSTFRSRWQGARPRMFTPPRCEPGALHPLPAHPASLNCEYMALPCRSAALPPGAIPGASPAVRSGHRERASAKGEG